MSHNSKHINRIWLLSGVFSLALVIITLFSIQEWFALQQKLDQPGAPATFLGFLYSLDWWKLLKQPWLWFYIPAYILTVLLFFGLDNIAKDLEHGAAPETRLRGVKRYMWAANARAVLTNIGLAIALWYFLDAVDAWGQFTAVVEGLFGRFFA